MGADGVTLDDLFDALYQDYYLPELAPGEFTVLMLAQRKGITTQKASRIIEAALADGRLEVAGERSVNNRKATAYRIKPPGG